jgi:hypothetical protein
LVCIATLITYFVSGFFWGYFESRTSLKALFLDWSQPSPSAYEEAPDGGEKDNHVDDDPGLTKPIIAPKDGGKG